MGKAATFEAVNDPLTGALSSIFGLRIGSCWGKDAAGANIIPFAAPVLAVPRPATQCSAVSDGESRNTGSQELVNRLRPCAASLLKRRLWLTGNGSAACGRPQNRGWKRAPRTIGQSPFAVTGTVILSAAVLSE